MCRPIGLWCFTTIEGNKSIDELKKGTAIETLKKQKSHIAALDPLIEPLKDFRGIVQEIETSKSLKPKSLTIKKSDFEVIKAKAFQCFVVESELAIEKTDHQATRKYSSKQFKENLNVMKENKALKAEIRSIKGEVDVYDE